METKSERASPYRLKQARRHGDVPRSGVLSTGIVGLALLLSLLFFLGPLVAALEEILRSGLKAAAQPTPMIDDASLRGAVDASFAILLVLLVVTSVGAFLQVGPLFSLRVFRPGGVFGMLPFRPADAFRSLALVALIGIAWAMYSYFVREDIAVLPRLGRASLREGALRVAAVWLGLVTGVLLLVGCVDRVWARHLWLSRLRMSRADIRREQRLLEADPRWDHYRRQSHKRVTQAGLEGLRAPGISLALFGVAGVVALAYSPSTVPRVVFAESGDLAARAGPLLREAAVPLVHDEFLARELMAYVGQPIPARAYTQVARRLAAALGTTVQRSDG